MEALHWAFAAQRDHLQSDGKLGDSEAAFFEDSRLEHFWNDATKHLRGMVSDGSSAPHAAAEITGAFLVPLWLGYGATENRGLGEAKSRKAALLESAARSNALRPKAVKLAHDLADLLDQIEDETGVPDALRMWELVQDVLPNVVQGIKSAKCYVPIPTAAYGPRVSAALRHLATKLDDPVVFQAPGMQSAKVTWRDWLREAYTNARHELDPPLELREADWVALVRVLFPDLAGRPSRESVADVLREFRQQASDGGIFKT